MKYLIIFLLLFGTQNLQADNYEKSLKKIAIDLAELIENRGFEKIAIWNFQAIQENEQHLSIPLTKDFSVFFTNATSTLKIYDRQHIKSLTHELKLQQSGLMDPKTAKDIGLFTGVEAIVTGNYAFHKNKVKLWIKVIETESAFQIAMKNALLPKQIKKYGKKENLQKKKEISPVKKKVLRNGRLKFFNRKTSHLRIVLTKDDFKKEVNVGSKSKIEVLNLPKGVYSCEIYFRSGDLFQKFDIDVKKKMKSITIRPQSIFGLRY